MGRPLLTMSKAEQLSGVADRKTALSANHVMQTRMRFKQKMHFESSGPPHKIKFVCILNTSIPEGVLPRAPETEVQELCSGGVALSKKDAQSFI